MLNVSHGSIAEWRVFSCEDGKLTVGFRPTVESEIISEAGAKGSVRFCVPDTQKWTWTELRFKPAIGVGHDNVAHLRITFPDCSDVVQQHALEGVVNLGPGAAKKRRLNQATCTKFLRFRRLLFEAIALPKHPSFHF
jgi:hypothetical protein